MTDLGNARVSQNVSRSAAVVALALVTTGCVGRAPMTKSSADLPTVSTLVGAWRLIETATRPESDNDAWDVRPVPQGGLYVFSERHYSLFYVLSPSARPRFVDANRPTDAEKAATYSTFIAGAGTYTFDGRTIAMRADFMKNPNEMTGEVWNLELDVMRGDTLRFIFKDPPFLPGRVWRFTIVRAH